MKKAEISVGGRYEAKVSGKLVTLRVTSVGENTRTGRTYWDCTNEATGGFIRVRGAARFRKEKVRCN